MFPFSAVVFSLFFKSVLARTHEIDANLCFKTPTNPFIFDSLILFAEFNRGSSTCFLQPARSDSYLSIRIEDLKLDGVCPSLTISEYSTLFTQEIPENENFEALQFQWPSDLNMLANANCTDYTTFFDRIFVTSVPGRKLMIEFKPINSDKVNSFNLTITSFYLGSTYSCPADHFRCWNAKDRCISDSLTCDGFDNCFDGSDETTYLCTGRILGLPVALFVILIIVGFIFLIVIITTIVFCVRRNHLRKRAPPECIDMTILPRRADEGRPLKKMNYA